MYWPKELIMKNYCSYSFEIHIYEWYEAMLILASKHFNESKLVQKGCEMVYMYTVDYYLSSYILNKFLVFPK